MFIRVTISNIVFVTTDCKNNHIGKVYKLGEVYLKHSEIGEKWMPTTHIEDFDHLLSLIKTKQKKEDFIFGKCNNFHIAIRGRSI